MILPFISYVDVYMSTLPLQTESGFFYQERREEIPGVNEQSWPTPFSPLLALPSVPYFSSSESKVLEILR